MLDVLLAVGSSVFLCVHTSFYKVSLHRKVDEKRGSGTARTLHIQLRLYKVLSSL